MPGFELGALAALLFALVLGPALGLAAARASAPLPAFARAAATSLALLAVFLAASLARAALGPCDPLFGLPMFLLAAAPSALLACALAVLCAQVTRRPLALYAALAALSFATTLARAYWGPAAALHDHLLGFWPGPIYDEVLVADGPLLRWRAATVVLAAAAVALAAALARLRRGHPATTRFTLAAALVLLFVPLHATGGTATRAALVRALGATRVTPRCTLHLPGEAPSDVAAALAAACDRDAAEVAAALAIDAPPRVTVFAHRSAAEKRRLVGAGETDYTKPWLAEIHLVLAPPPHRILRHEIVHAVASALAPGPLHVPARGRLLPSGGLVEGLAMALAPGSRYSLHERARALRDLGLAPPLPRLLGDAGFVSAAPARAYVAAGSFVRWLLDTRGPATVAAAYATADVARAAGMPVSELAAEWNRHLDAIVVPPELAAHAAERFRDPGLFGARCARERAARVHPR